MEANRHVQVIIPPLPHSYINSEQETKAIPTDSENLRKFKTLSFDQALQFTPLTTSVLPAYDRIPVPQIGRSKEAVRLTSSAERKGIQQIVTQYSPSRIKERLQNLLRSDILPEYKFKKGLPLDKQAHPGEQTAKQLDHSLSSIGRIVYESTAIDYKYQLPQDAAAVEAVSKSRVSVIDDGKSQNSKPTVKALGGDNEVSQGLKTQSQITPKPIFQSVRVDIPKSASKPSLEAATTNLDSFKRNKSGLDGNTLPISIHVRSQKEASEAALQHFQNNLLEVFEAQDQLDAGSTLAYEAGILNPVDDGDDSEANLSLKTMERLLADLKKLVGMKMLSDVSSEHLRRLQLLCETPIDRLQTINLKIQPDADPDDRKTWKRNLQKAHAGLFSAMLFLHTIQSSFPDESLLSTEALAWIPSALRNVCENCLIPITEARPDDAPELFKIATMHKDDLKKLLESARKVLDLISTTCTQTRGLEDAVNPIEFLAAKLIFVQNANSDKQSTIGIQVYEKMRKTAMSSLARIFARFLAERGTILDEVLTSLDKLPSNSRSARQYRLGDGKSVQLISALFMQLVQNTALEIPDRRTKSKRNAHGKSLEATENEEDNDGEHDMMSVDDQSDIDQGNAFTRLQAKSTALFDVAARSAQEIVLYLVGRASKTTKTGDSPYRNVLDLFIEDMVAVISMPEWPSSELMLRIMAAKMTDMAQSEKTAAAKNMALECLGTMGSAISTLKASLQRQCASCLRDGKPSSSIADHLSKLATDQDQGGMKNEDLIAFDGPFAIVSRHLWTEADQGLRNLSACGFFLAQYAKIVSLIVDANSFNENDIEAQPIRVANFLLTSITQIGSGLVEGQNFDAVSRDEAELAYTLSVLNMGFCRRFGMIVKVLSTSFTSDQALVRSRSLKSVVTMLETDSTLLDRDQSIADDVFKCASDDSAMVRDSALALIARFIITKPSLEQKGIQRLLECASDAKVGVQKRAIGHLKEIYLKDNRTLLKATISRVILKRTVDHEDTVAELAKKTLTDIWLAPALSLFQQASEQAKTKVAIEDLTSDIVNCISYDAATLCQLLRKFLKLTLTSDTKNASRIRDLYASIVDILFEKVISGQDDQGPLMVLTSFAEADPPLIPPANLGKLQPYLGNLRSENDLFMFKAVISIFGCVLPHLSVTHKPLLHEIQNALMKAISSLGRRTELDTVMSCLQVIDGVLQNTRRLVKLAGSIMLKIRSGTASLTKSEDVVPQLLKLLRIAGAMARYIDLEGERQSFAQEVKDMKSHSVAEYTAHTLLPLTQVSQPHKVRLLALESLGSLCQAVPGQLNQRSIRDAFFSTFVANENGVALTDRDSLQGVVLKVFDELYAQRAHNKEEEEGNSEEKEKQELGKLGGDSKTRDGDSAISMVTGNVAKSALAVALSTPSDNALIATRTLSSISHQGLNHPKHSLLAFVALSTCPDVRIANVAHDAHRLLHQQHESVCEREYMSAVHEAFEYQCKVIGDSRGARSAGYRSKLASCFEIVNTSGGKYVKKFLSGLVSRVSAKISTDNNVLSMEQVYWTQFAVQNLVFFEFSKVDEVLHAILQLELAYSKKGIEISQLLEAALSTEPRSRNGDDAVIGTEMYNRDSAGSDTALLNAVNDLGCVRRLAPLAVTLTIMMEGRSYLKRQYGVGRDVRTAISNSKQAKDTAKAPTRIHGITGEKFWTQSNAVVAQLQDDSGMLYCCQNFVTLMSMDDEINVNEDDIARDASESMAPSELHDYTRGATPGGVKRKLSPSANSTPAKRNAGRPRKEQRRSMSSVSANGSDTDLMA